MTATARGVFALCALAACMDGTTSDDPPSQSIEQQKDIPFAGVAELDVLFVIDNSGSMLEEQASLAINYERFGRVFESIAGPCPPSLHIGVISGDLGIEPLAAAGCDAAGGDGAALQNTARVPGCSPPVEPFLRDEIDEDGQRHTSFTGPLHEALPCIAQLGADGCGFQRPFEAMRLALDRDDGFRRDGAYLMVVLISDQDDCSVTNTALFDPAETALGPLSAFRCFEAGVECSPDDPRTLGAKSDCAPREDSAYAGHVGDYAVYLAGLPTAGVFVATIAGDAEPVEVVDNDGDGDPSLAPSCQSATARASPGIRLAELAAQFPQRNTVTSICDEDLTPALADFFNGIVDTGVPCLDGNLVDTDDAQPGVQPECAVTEVRRSPGTPDTATVLPQCDDPTDPARSSNLPCYLTPVDPLACPNTPSQLTVARYPSCSLGSGHLEVRCLAE